MRRPRASIGWMMTFIGVIAVNIASVRVLANREPRPVWLAGLYPMAFALQVGLISLIYRPGRSRAFWAGFLLGGLLALSSCACYIAYPTEQSKGPGVATTTTPGPWATRCWDRYAEALAPLIEPLAVTGWLDHPPVQLTLITILAILPQLAIAGVGGLSACLLLRVMQARPEPRPEAEPVLP